MERIRLTAGQGSGLHARPAARFVRTAAQFNSAVMIEANGKQADGKSILQVLGLGAAGGAELLISIDGPDERACAAAIRELLGNDT